jgi:DNA-binding Lrp family transcriptional regulator
MTSAFVLINCHFPFDGKIMNKISNIPHVLTVHRTEGRYDLIVKVSAETDEKLMEIISKNINKIDGVDATISLTITKGHPAT